MTDRYLYTCLEQELQRPCKNLATWLSPQLRQVLIGPLKNTDPCMIEAVRRAKPLLQRFLRLHPTFRYHRRRSVSNKPWKSQILASTELVPVVVMKKLHKRKLLKGGVPVLVVEET